MFATLVLIGIPSETNPGIVMSSMQLLTLNFFEIDLLPCPGGYTIRSIETREGLWGCVCDSELEELLLCSDDQNTIFIRVCIIIHFM